VTLLVWTAPRRWDLGRSKEALLPPAFAAVVVVRLGEAAELAGCWWMGLHSSLGAAARAGEEPDAGAACQLEGSGLDLNCGAAVCAVEAWQRSGRPGEGQPGHGDD